MSAFADLALLMAANVILFIGTMLYRGGVTVTRIRASTVAVLYFVCVAVGTAFTAYRYQLSSLGEILWKLVLVAAIAGLVVVIYVIAAYFGARKVDREIGE
jgi:hypothetical protein